LVGIGVIVVVNVLANWAAWRQPRFVQHVAKALVTPVMGLLLDCPAPRAEFHREDISGMASTSHGRRRVTVYKNWRAARP
jgi:hypothetical protein